MTHVGQLEQIYCPRLDVLCAFSRSELIISQRGIINIMVYCPEYHLKRYHCFPIKRFLSEGQKIQAFIWILVNKSKLLSLHVSGPDYDPPRCMSNQEFSVY